MTIPITGQPPVPSLSEPDTFNTKALNLFTWQTGSMLDQFNNVDPNDFFDIPALTAAAAQSQTKNATINGAFDIWQRGDTKTGQGYGADRWLNYMTGGTVTQSKQTFAIGTKLGRNAPTFYLRHTVSGQSASNYAITTQRIEGVNSFAGETVTVLGWAKRASGAGNIVVELSQKFGSGGGESLEVKAPPVTVALTGSWVPFAATIAVPSISGKTLGLNKDDNLELNFWASGGSVYNGRTNSLGLQTIGVDYWGIHILQGTHGVEACDNYVAPRVVDELARCQWYFFPIIPKGTPTNVRFVNIFGNDEGPYFQATTPVCLRRVPTLEYGGGFKAYNTGIVNGTSSVLALYTTDPNLPQNSFMIKATDLIMSDSEFGYFRTNGSDCYIFLDAEL